MSIGNRIFASTWRQAPDLVEGFRNIPVANISDSMSRLAAGGSALRPFHDGTYLCGQALTVKVRPGDNLFVHKAISMARPGDVIVVDAGGDLTNAIIGEFMIAHLERRGGAGFVIDGAVRDAGAVRNGSMPVFAAGVTHGGPYKDGPGEVNVNVRVGGQSVSPGDIIVGDEDGVLAIRLEDAPEVLRAAKAKHAAEQAMWARVREGTEDRGWIDKKLQQLGTKFIA